MTYKEFKGIKEGTIIKLNNNRYIILGNSKYNVSVGLCVKLCNNEYTSELIKFTLYDILYNADYIGMSSIDIKLLMIKLRLHYSKDKDMLDGLNCLGNIESNHFFYTMKDINEDYNNSFRTLTYICCYYSFIHKCYLTVKNLNKYWDKINDFRGDIIINDSTQIVEKNIPNTALVTLFDFHAQPN